MLRKRTLHRQAGRRRVRRAVRQALAWHWRHGSLPDLPVRQALCRYYHRTPYVRRGER